MNELTIEQLTWVADVKEQLNAGEAARDVATAEALLKNHQDLCDDIRTHQDEYVDEAHDFVDDCQWHLTTNFCLFGE